MDTTDLLIAACGIALGGFIKGATGAAAPVIGVPVLALVFDVPLAVSVFAILNVFSNAWQAWNYRIHQTSKKLVWGLSLAGAFGIIIGSYLLATLHMDLLMAALAILVLLYVTLRLARPNWALARKRAETLAPVAGLCGGIMQGAGGISAPASITFLNAMKLERTEFVATIAVFFLVMSSVQVITLTSLGILTLHYAALSVPALIPLFGAMRLGEWAAKRISKVAFDRIVLIILTVIALRLIYGATG